MFPLIRPHRRTLFPIILGKIALLILLLSAAVQNVGAQTLAFPGALGFGRFATGGRTGTVYHVTSLADDGSAGTFREAVSEGNRIIVFDVGGYIVLNSAVSCASGLTIAGQTAPGGGIGIMGHEVSFSVQQNEIVRYVRFRPGSLASSTEDGINIGDGTNMIFDHIAIEFAPYNNLDATGSRTDSNLITVENSILGDPIGQQFNAHTQALNNDISWFYNLFVSGHDRNPMAKMETIFINNVVYDYQAGYTAADTGSHFSHDIVNNYFITGPSTTSAGDDFFQMDGNISAYSTGNLLDSSRNGTLGGSSTTPGGVVVLNAPWSALTTATPTYPTATAYKYDVSLAGPLPRDQVDQVVLSDVTSLGTGGRIYSSQTDDGLGNNGYGTINGGTLLTDNDGDGIPDVWKNAVGLPLNSNEAMTIAANGYANIENYLNWLAGPHAFVGTNATVMDLWPYTLGFTNGATYTFSSMTNCSVTLTNSHYAFVVPTPGLAGLGSFNFAVKDNAGAAMTNTMGLLVTIVYTPKNLVWRGDGVSNHWDNTNTVDWYNGNNLITFNPTDNVTFDDSGSNSPAINVAVPVSPGSMVVAANQNYTFSGTGAITGAGTMTITGTNTVTFSTTNTYTGNTTINNATVQLTGPSSLGTGTVILNGGTINQNSGNWIANTISNLGTSTLNFNYGSTLYPTLSLTGGGILNVNSTGGGVFTPGGTQSTFTGTVNVNCDMRESSSPFGSSTAAWNLGTTGGIYNKSGGVIVYLGALTGATGSSLYGASTASSPANTFVVGGLNTSTTFGGLISNGGGPASLVKVGTGTLTLSANNTFTGATTVSNGTLLVTGNLTGSPVNVVSGATLSGAAILGGGLTGQAGCIISPGLGLRNSGVFVVSNNINLTSPNMYFDLTGSPAGTNDQIQMAGGTLVMSGTQTYQFNMINNALGAGTYTLIGGATNSNATSVGFANNLPGNTRQTFVMARPSSGNGVSGYVQLQVTGNAGSLIWSGTNGNTWDLTTTTNWLNGGQPDEFYNLDQVRFDDTSTNGTVTITNVVAPATVLVTNSQTTYTIGGGVLGGIATLTKTGPGTLILNSSNSFSGGTYVNGGTLELVNNFYAGGTGPVAMNNATFYLNGVGTSTALACVGTNTLLTYGQPYANFSLLGGGWLNLSLGGGGTFSPGGDWSGYNGTLYFLTSNWLRVYGATTFGSSNAVWNFGTVGGINNRSGGVTVYMGALFGGTGTALAGASTTANYTDYVIGGVNTNSVFNGTITDGAAATSVAFQGPGSLTLGGNNTFSGGLTVNAGTLYVNNLTGTGAGTGVVTINSGATLGGNGSIGGIVSMAAGATLSPGNNNVTGLLTITNNLTLNNGSTLQFSLGTYSDQVDVTGDLTLGGTLNLSAAAGFGPGTYTLFNYQGALDVGTLTMGTAPAGYTYTFDTSSLGEVNLVVSLPGFENIRTTGTNLVFNGFGGSSNATYYLLSSTNLALPTTQWTRLLTNHFDGSGNFNLTNAINPKSAQNFYLLQLN